MWFYDNEPLPLTDLFKNSWVLWRATIHFAWFWALLITLLFWVSDYFSFERVQTLLPWKNIPFQLDLIMMIVIFFIPWSFSKSALMAHMHYFAIGEQRVISKATVISLKKIIPVTIASIIYQAVTFLGLFLLIFPGIFLGILFFMFLPLIVLDNKSIFQSFKLSAKLVFGSWWETFGLTAIPLFLIFLIREIMIRYFPNNLFMQGAAILLLTVLIPYSYAQLLIQYHSLRIRKNKYLSD